jgi:hypothetical protein
MARRLIFCLRTRYKKLMTRKAIELYLEALTEEERSAALNQQLLQLRQNSNAKDLKELAHRWKPINTDKNLPLSRLERKFYLCLSVFICGPLKSFLRRWLRRRGTRAFFGFASGNLRLQCAIPGAAVDLLFANAVETRGIATSFGHDFLFS